MADFSEMLNGILSNPQAMQQMMALAQSLGLQGQGGQPQQSAPTPPPPPPQLPQQPAGPDAAPSGLSADVQANGWGRTAAGPLPGPEALRPPGPGGKAGPGHPGGKNIPPCRKRPAKAGPTNPFRQVSSMYNRYIPQGDGTYQRSRLPESRPPRPPRPRPPEPPKPAPPPCPPPEEPCPPECPDPPAEQPCPPDRPKPPVPCPPPEPPCGHRPPPREEPCSAVSFLQSLLPKNMDTGDLLMLLILLLLIQDGSEDAPTALLTIALFFLL